MLESVTGNKYKFKKAPPCDVIYFLMTPETGRDSDRWVFYDFQKEMGVQIVCDGMNLFSPSHILAIEREKMERKPNLCAYFFQYRNYRLLRRFKCNSIFAGVFWLLGMLVCLLEPAYIMPMIPYLVVDGLMCVHFVYSYLHFYKECCLTGASEPSKKPAHPGYGCDD